jgi:hypothetical protein
VCIRGADTQTIGSELDLPNGFLARHVQDAAPRHKTGEPGHQCTLSYSRVTGYEDDRPGHDSTSKHSIQLAETGGDSLLVVDLDVFESDHFRGLQTKARDPGWTTITGVGYRLFHQ